MTPTNSTVTRPTRVRWLICVLACATSWLLYLHRYAWGVIKPALKEEFPDLSDVELGWLDSAFQITYGIGQVPGGAAGDLLGPHKVLTALIFLWTLCGTAVAWVPGNQTLLGTVRGLFGLAQAGAYPVLSQVTRHWFPLGVRTTVQGAITAFGRIGGASASFFIATLLMSWVGLGWRASLFVLAVPGLLLAAAVGAVFRNTPRTHPWCNVQECQLIEGTETATLGRTRPTLQLTIRGGVTLAMLLVYSFCSTFADQLYVFWIPLFLKEGKGLSNEAMGIFAMLPLLGGATGGVVSGLLNDFMLRIAGRRFARASVAFTGKFLAAILIAVSVPIADGRLVMVALFLCKFFGDWSLVSLWGALTDISGRAAGTVFGIVNTIGTVGAFAAGPIMGSVKERHGWEALFYLVAGVYLAAACCWLFIDSNRPLVAERVAE